MLGSGVISQVFSFAGYIFALCLLFFLWRQREKNSRTVFANEALQDDKNRLEEELRTSLLKITEAEKQIKGLELQEREKEAELKWSKETLESERKNFEKLKEQMQESFKGVAATALEGNNRQFLELAQQVLGQQNQKAETSLDKKEQAIQELVKPLKESLQRYQEQANEMEKDRQRSYATVEMELKKVIEASQSLSTETTALKNALKKPHIRGRWGEVQLRNCMELAGMSEFADVSFQDGQTTGEGKRLIPDMTVRMPGDRVVIVDAKTPVDAFLASLDAETEEQRTIEMTRHGKHVRTHVMQLSEKGYAQEWKNSADFTVMFLPNESFLYAALETQPDLVDFALQKKILIATPPTLIGLLKVIRFGWNEQKLARNAMAISEAGSELHKRVVDFVEAYAEIGKSLKKAQETYEKGTMRLNSRVVVQARRLEELGAKGNKEMPELLN